MTLRVNEVYLSFQGEGPNTGAPTIFVRFTGCNFKCPGWPCDSQHAIDPKLFTKDQRFMSPQELVDEIMMFWFGGVNICFTGGEVFLQPAQDLESALDLLQSATRGADTEVFTNGSQEITRTMRTLFNTIVLDKKLPGSGELYDKGDEDINLSRNLRQLTGRDAIKFTIASAEDFESAREWWNSYMSLENAHFGIPMFFAGVVWGKMKEEELAAMILEAGLPWNLNVQMHKFIWDPEARRT